MHGYDDMHPFSFLTTKGYIVGHATTINPNNARDIGATFARMGMTDVDLAGYFGVDQTFVFIARMHGATYVARMAWEDTRWIDYGPWFNDPAQGNVDPIDNRAHIDVVKFARAYNTYARTSSHVHRPHHMQLVMCAEDTGDGESGPSMSEWLDVVERDNKEA